MGEKTASRGFLTPFEGMQVTGLPIHTLVRGAFVMRDRALVEARRGHGRSVRRVQQMPQARPCHVDQTLAAVTAMKA
jgi:dihydroorotase